MNTIKTNIPFVLIAALCLTVAGCGENNKSDSGQQTSDTHEHNHDEPITQTVSGQLSGFDCAVVGVLCPSTHRGADYTTGVFTDDEAFYHIVNIPQSFLRQYFLETVEVEGTVYHPYEQAIEPEAIYLQKEDGRRLVYESGYFIDENDRRATFQDGRFQDDRWVVQ